MRIRITKQLTMNEELVAEVRLKDCREWESKVSPVLGWLDTRQYETNMRMVEATKAIGQLDVAGYETLRTIFARIHGIQLAPSVSVPEGTSA